MADSCRAFVHPKTFIHAQKRRWNAFLYKTYNYICICIYIYMAIGHSRTFIQTQNARLWWKLESTIADNYCGVFHQSAMKSTIKIWSQMIVKNCSIFYRLQFHSVPSQPSLSTNQTGLLSSRLFTENSEPDHMLRRFR